MMRYIIKTNVLPQVNNTWKSKICDLRNTKLLTYEVVMNTSEIILHNFILNSEMILKFFYVFYSFRMTNLSLY